MFTTASKITGKELAIFIAEHAGGQTELIGLYDRYKGAVEILKRVLLNGKGEPATVNNQLAHDFRGTITDGITGYMFGKEVSWQIIDDTDHPKYKDAELAKVNEAIRELRIASNLADLDSRTGKFQSICGSGVRLCYLNTEGEVRISHVNPWDALFVYDANGDCILAIRYYTMADADGKDQVYAEVYDQDQVSFWKKEKDAEEFEPHTDRITAGGTVGSEIMPHGFKGVPLIEFVNNDERQGDWKKVETLINAYDKVRSDGVNELEKHATALLAFFNGAEIDNEEMEKAKAAGALNVLEGDVKWLIKNLPVEFMESLLKGLEGDIYRFSQTVNMSAEHFAGTAVSGAARAWMLLPMENKCANKERKFKKGLQVQAELISSVWQSKQIPLFPYDLDYQFTRNVPTELKLSIEVFEKLIGNLADEDVLKLMPWCDDPAAMAKRRQEFLDKNGVDLDEEGNGDGEEEPGTEE